MYVAIFVPHALICKKLMEKDYDAFDLKIITPEKTFFEGNTEQIIVRTVSGDIGILAGHAPYVANIVSSPFRIKIEGEFRTAAISGGL